uniref:Uncharacterized protein n=1 Tax=Globisporangium ultimum (strain ATCC 200006 / CBS 805.95 / DAOM BR144) TaxID=431595 RepID=K3W662_GLOUD
MKKTYSERSTMMKHLVDAIEKTTGCPIPTNLTEQQTTELFHVGIEGFSLAPSKPKRRLFQLFVATTLRLVREALQQQNPDR